LGCGGDGGAVAVGLVKTQSGHPPEARMTQRKVGSCHTIFPEPALRISGQKRGSCHPRATINFSGWPSPVQRKRPFAEVSQFDTIHVVLPN
jgi:hypothetical protein